LLVRPNVYIRGCLAIGTQEFRQLAGGLSQAQQDKDLLGGPAPVSVSLAVEVFSYLFHVAVTLAFSVAFFLVAYAWLLVIAPIQYPLYLFCGAPARMFGGSTFSPANLGHEMVSEPDPLQEAVDETAHRQAPHAVPHYDQEEDAEKGAIMNGLLPTAFATRPVTFTSSLASLVLFGHSHLL
jgi:hypothetical protein